MGSSVTETGSGTHSASVDPVDASYSAGAVFPGTITVKVVIDAKDGVGAWTEATTPITYQVTDTSGVGTTQSFAGDVQSFSSADINGGDDVRVRLKEVTTVGSPDSSNVTIDPVDARFNIFTGTETLTSKTPTPADKHTWTALGVA